MKKVVVFLIINSFFCSCEKEKPVIADFDYEEQISGLVNFKNKSLNATEYEWDFNNGKSSNEKNPSFIFANNKDYFVTLTAKGESGQNSKSKTIRVKTAPVTGNLIFWTNFKSPAQIQININGDFVGNNTKYIIGDTPPGCFTDGYVTLNLKEGRYSFTAVEVELGGRKWVGDIDISNGICKSLKLLK